MIPTLVQRLRYWHGDPDEVMTEAAIEIELLTAELATANTVIDELQADAGRLRTIEANGWGIERDLEGDWRAVEFRRYGSPIRFAEKASLGAAIDAARALRKGERHEQHLHKNVRRLPAL